MWTFDAFPAAKMKAAYGWAPDKALLDRIQASAVRLTSGCSASVISPHRFVVTNWHCSVECAQTNSSAPSDYVRDGYLAATRGDEKKCPGTQAEILTGISDVTPRVKAEIAKVSPDKASKARDAEVARIESDGCTIRTRIRCEVVDLYQGGEYKLYTYRKYSDVRLAFIPEQAIGFFGGDPDNFNFPRYNLDVSFVRLYENGKPVDTPTHSAGARMRPSPAKRCFSLAIRARPRASKPCRSSAFDRDWAIPTASFCAPSSSAGSTPIGASPTKTAARRPSSSSASRIPTKAFYGQWRALLDPAFMATKAKEEADLAPPSPTTRPWRRRSAIHGRTLTRRPTLDRDGLSSPRHAGAPGRFCARSSIGWARTLVRGAAERAKPNSERMRELHRFAPAADGEAAPAGAADLSAGSSAPALEFWLSKTRQLLTVDDPR